MIKLSVCMCVGQRFDLSFFLLDLAISLFSNEMQEGNIHLGLNSYF